MKVLKQFLEKVTKRVQKLSFFMFFPTLLRFETFTHPKFLVLRWSWLLRNYSRRLSVKTYI